MTSSVQRVRLADSAFEGYGLAFGGTNALARPRLLEWERGDGQAEVKVFTDAKIRDASQDPAPRKVALLLESPAVRARLYASMPYYAEGFHRVLTFHQPLVERGGPFRFYPLGGSWIHPGDWGFKVREKTKMVSLIASAKTGQKGHRLRHQAARLPGVEAFGAPYGGWIPDKVPALRPYRYSVIIENTRSNWYFSEKLIDCLTQGTVPIYWGCPEINRFFEPGGIISFQTVEELAAILGGVVSEQDYRRRLTAVRANLDAARRYWCPEDWIVENYPGIFFGGDEKG